MVFNVLTDIEPIIRDAPDFLLSEYLSDIARIHHESAQIDAHLYTDAVAEVKRLQIASAEFLRRAFDLDYAQATTLIQLMEADGIIQRTTHRSRDSRRGWRYEVVEDCAAGS